MVSSTSRITVTPDTPNDILDAELRNYVQHQWYSDFQSTSRISDAAERLEQRYATTDSVVRRLLIPLCAVVGPSLGFLPDEHQRKIAVGAFALSGALLAATAEWLEYELGRQGERKESVDRLLETIVGDLMLEGVVRERFQISEARIKSALTRILKDSPKTA